MFLIGILCLSNTGWYALEVKMESWGVRSFKFYWQNVEDQYLGPGFVLISQQKISKFGKQKKQKYSDICYFEKFNYQTQVGCCKVFAQHTTEDILNII